MAKLAFRKKACGEVLGNFIHGVTFRCGLDLNHPGDHVYENKHKGVYAAWHNVPGGVYVTKYTSGRK